MPAIMETTVHDMKTNLSKYAAGLLDGTYDEIVVKNRSTPILRVLPYDAPGSKGLEFGASARRGHVVVSDGWDMNDGDAEIAKMFDEELR